MSSYRITILLLALIANPVTAQSSYQREVEGFLAPYRSIEVSSTETGVVESIQVKIGDVVRKGDILLKLNREILEKTIIVAEHESQARGAVKIAKAELDSQRRRHQKVSELFERGHGRQNEVDRAEADVEVAIGKLMRAQEEAVTKRHELEQIRAKLSLRDIRSPIDGIVVEIMREVGEAVTPTQPVVVKVVNIDMLKAKYDVPPDAAKNLVKGAPIQLVGLDESKIHGVVEWVSPIIKPDSETVQVIVRVDNQERLYTSGEYCILIPPAEKFAGKLKTNPQPVSYSK